MVEAGFWNRSAWVLKTFGEERFAKRIAQAIVGYNKRVVQSGAEPLKQNFTN